MPSHYHEPHSRAMARVTQTGESRLAGQTIELTGLRKDGTVFRLALSLPMWKANTGTCFSGIIRDLAERKREEQTRARLTAMVFEEAERRRIAGELHDQIGQMLTALKLTLEAVGRQPDVTSRGKLEIAQRSVEELIRRVHDMRSEEHTSELQSHSDLVCRLLLEKKKKNKKTIQHRAK